MTIRLMHRLAALILLIAASAPLAAQNQLDAQTWMEGMVNTLPNFFCQDDQYFMQCFEVSLDECREVTSRQTRRCVGELGDQIPTVLNMPDDGRKWGTEVGRCAGIGYDLELVERKSTTPACNPST